MIFAALAFIASWLTLAPPEADQGAVMSKKSGSSKSFKPPKAAKLPRTTVTPLVQPRTTWQRDASAVLADAPASPASSPSRTLGLAATRRSANKFEMSEGRGVPASLRAGK